MTRKPMALGMSMLMAIGCVAQRTPVERDELAQHAAPAMKDEKKERLVQAPAETPKLPAKSDQLRSLGYVTNGAAAAASARDQEFNTERYNHRVDNAFKTALRDPLSTFSIDVDTASYTNVRRFLSEGTLPPADAVRIEEMLNYFSYDDPAPVAGEPFAVSTELATCPWSETHKLLRIALKATPIQFAERKPGNFVFLIDVSGSMQSADKLALVQSSLKMLARQMLPSDTIAIVVYAGAAGLVLPPTHDRDAVEAAIDALQAGGSTAGGEGINLAYAVAAQNFIKGRQSRDTSHRRRLQRGRVE
ncbi:MAG: von Willebrand factor type A domain-containing protein [Acidobacteriota bacterium]